MHQALTVHVDFRRDALRHVFGVDQDDKLPVARSGRKLVHTTIPNSRAAHAFKHASPAIEQPSNGRIAAGSAER